MPEATEVFCSEGKTWLPSWLLRPAVEIRIEDEINDALVDRVCNQLRVARLSPISALWNSGGGRARAGIRLYQAVRRPRAHVTGYVGPGNSCSWAGAIGFLGCDERTADTTARFALHRGVYESVGGRESAALL